VLDSDPDDEFDEMLAKAEASLRALLPADVPDPVRISTVQS
jgi:anthranilate/para-aminobenzoate synthase component I